ncbi:hypothetical protein MKW94_025520 [Papaver nudicaule]|uniref:RRM domain-containing protein n=1 Tax=Papaver nudicaule TaxID=74823 RepID=A0AA41SDU8_PAPNU|nr:hypothetical protein [Papaver nudicaule]
MDPRGPRTHSYQFQDTSGVLEVISHKIEEHEEGVRTSLKLLLRQVHFFIEALGSSLGISEAEAAEARAELIAELEKKRCLFKEAEQNMSWDLRLFVDNLPVNVDISKFVALLLTAGGEVRMVRVFCGKITGRNSGFGFVTMSSAEEAQAAAQRLNGSLIGGKAIRVTYGPPVPAELPKENFQSRGRRGGGGGSDSSKRLYVGNLPFCVDDQALWTLFSKQGKVLEARVKYCKGTNTSRGFGFVTYGSTKEVNNALSSLNGFELAGRKIRVSVAEERPGSF